MLRFGLRRSVVFAAALASSLGVAGCTRDAASASDTKHPFEGTIEWQGLQGRPPGKPWSMRCTMRHEDLLCDVALSKRHLQLGFRGPGNTLCFRAPSMPVWIPLSLQTVVALFSLLPESDRQEAARTTQGQYRFTGRQGRYLNRSCEVVEVHEKDGAVRETCYSQEEFFEGDQKLAPLLVQMGIDAGFVSTLSKYGLGLQVTARRPSGEPSMVGEVTRMDAHPVDPNTFAGVCGMK